jgi:predicted MFS family arabinose efflux permease
MLEPSDNAEKTIQKRFIPSLMLALFATGMLDVLASLFLMDISASFLGSTSKSALGTASLIVTVSSAAAVATGLLNGFLSIRIKHKTLLLFGALCIVIGSIGCFLAPNFTAMVIFYPFDGVGTIIVSSMAFTLVGESLPLNKRAKEIGWVTAGAIMASAIGFPVAGFIASIAGWKSYLLWYSLPISIVALFLAFFSVPHKRIETQSKESIKESFKQVWLNKSATACLIGNMLINAAGIWSFYAATFWRQQFSISVQNVGVITLVVVLIYALGSIVGGQLVNRVGRKRLTVASWIGRGLLIAAIVFMPSFWTAFAMSAFATFIGGIAIASGLSLNLEQAPKSRGTMMSMGAVFSAVGATLGVSAGGLALGQSGFQTLGLTFGVFGVASAVIIFFLAKEPCK